MKYFLVLALSVCLVGCGTTLNSAAPNTIVQQTQANEDPVPPTTPPSRTPPPTNPPPVNTPPPAPPGPESYDMLAWMTMDPTLAASHHMSGTANPIYTNVQSDRFFWTKSGQGFR